MNISFWNAMKQEFLCRGTRSSLSGKGHVNLKDAWCDISDGELFIKGMHITPYEKDGLFRTDPMRVRKLLMHRQEINRMFGKVKQGGLTLVPLSLYFKDSRVKVQVGLCKG